MTRRQIAAGTAWSVLAAGWTPAGWEDIVQWAALAGGGWLAATFAHEARKARRTGRHGAGRGAPPALEPPARPQDPDPRMLEFGGRFCRPGGLLEGAACGQFREVPDGFMFEVSFPPDTAHSITDVEAAKVLIAKLYDVTRADVSVSYVPGARSESRCQLVVRKPPPQTAEGRLNPASNRWDGVSTWDHATGLVALGLFADGTTAHYRMNTPFSGASLGVVAGVPGAGKSGTINVLCAEAGLARLCPACLRQQQGSCTRHRPQRVMNLWIADPQEQGMALWRGRADLMGWGVAGTIELLEFTQAAARARSAALAGMEWHDTGPDGKPRRNTGKTRFDTPEPGFPMIFLALDELPVLVKYHDQDLARHALQIIVGGILEWRKLGIHLLIGTPVLDVSQIGVREIREIIKFLNSVAHRVDEVTTSTGGITGDPTELPAGDPGAGYLNGPDERPGDRFHTKICPDYLRPGMTGADIRHLAGIIAATPVAYDPGTTSVMQQWGIGHQQVFTEYRGNAAPEPAGTAGPPPPGTAEGPGIGGLAYREDAEKVLAALSARPGAEIMDLMEATGLSLGAVGRSLDALAANGQLTGTSTGLYTAPPTQRPEEAR